MCDKKTGNLSKPSCAGAKPGDPIDKTNGKCPDTEKKYEYELVELVESVTQDKEKWVKGAGMDTADAALFTASTARSEKEGADFKQFINLDRDLQGQAKRHPEYGREIIFRARIQEKGGKTDKLSGISVEFTFKRTDGPDRKDPPAPEPSVWKTADLTGDDKEGFGGKNGAPTVAAVTDDKGWTAPVSFFLSAYGGDKFEISAALAPATPGASGSKPIKTKALYVVWRKFWYQMTYATGYNPPQPTKGEATYTEVGADMVKANSKVFTKADLPADLQDRTFYKEFMIVSGGGNGDVAVIGGHNKDEIAKMHTSEPEHPLKANLIVCEHQCDPFGATQSGIHKLTAQNQTITLAQGTGGPIVCKPPLKAGASLVIVAEWSPTQVPWSKGGDLTDADIEIDSARTSTLSVKIKLPAAAPTPTAAKPLFVKIQVESAKSFLGESFGSGQILCVYRPSAAANSPGSEQDFNDTAAHEVGHMWNQTPLPGKQPGSLKDHPFQHVGHGGSGSHCRHGATVAAGPVNWQNAAEDNPKPVDGDCLLYYQFSVKCSHKFCAICKPHLRLHDMSKFG